MKTVASDTVGASASASARPCHALIVVMVLLLSACGTTGVIPPKTPQEPVPVFLLDHGRHTSLVLPAPDGTMTRYVYGDWRYYAERRTGLGYAIAAISWPTQSALGRRHLPGPPTEAAVRVQVRVYAQEIHAFPAEAARVAALRGRLNAYFETGEVRETPEVDLSFVAYPHPYSLRNNSNAVIADWLTELGAEVSRRPVWAGWRVQTKAEGRRMQDE